MGTRRSGFDGPQFALPPLGSAVRNVLIVMGVLYVTELVVSNFVLPSPSLLYQWLAWRPSLDLTLLWQPVTKFLVQGPGVLGVLLNMVVVYFFLPWVMDRFPRKQLVQIVLAVVLGCFAAGMVWFGIASIAQAAGVPASAFWLARDAMGWEPFMMGMIALFSLALPNQTIQLFFVLPLKAGLVIWLSVGFAALSFLAAPGVDSFELFGAVGGILAWWHLLGPGQTRRKFKRTGRRIEKDLKLRVFDGGRQGGQGPDEYIN